MYNRFIRFPALVYRGACAALFLTGPYLQALVLGLYPTTDGGSLRHSRNNNSFGTQRNPRGPPRIPSSWRTSEIRLPTLFTSGRHDEATPAIAETNHRKITGSEWVVFEQSSHAAHLVEEDEFRRVVNDFTGRSLY
jgi:pimeloyl-ACP methyl ester carboxylesterase